MMKRRAACIVLIGCLLMTGIPAGAAEWRDGLGPAQPYEGVPAVDLEETMGYTMLFPREKMPAEHFCDVLEFYLPREDIRRGEGVLRLYDENGLVNESSFADPDQVEIRPLEEEELEGLMWGGGTCVCVHLPVSLTVGGSYYVHMDAGCFTAAEGKVTSLPIASDTVWVPVVLGDFGVNALSYREGGAALFTGSTAEGTPAEEQAAKLAELPAVLTPKTGDAVTFSLQMGGEAVSAVAYSENNSVIFEQPEYTQSAVVSGKIVSDDISWGLVFLNENGDVLDIINGTK